MLSDPVFPNATFERLTPLFLCLLAALPGACSFDASKLRSAGISNPDTVAAASDGILAGSGGTFAPADTGLVGSGGITTQADTGMGGSSGALGRTDSGDGRNPADVEVGLAAADGGLEGPQSDSLVLDQDPDDATEPLDSTAQSDTTVARDLVAPSDVTVQPDEAQAPDVLVPPDLSATETLTKDVSDTGSPPSMFCNPEDLDLVACYRFEGNTNDESSYANHGTAKNVSYVTGTVGQGIRTSSNSDIAVPTSASLSPANVITIELWARPQSTLASGRAGLVDNEGEYGLFVNAGNGVTCTAGGGSVNASSVVATTGWTHVACVYDGANLRLYRNGSQVGSVPQTGRMTISGTWG